MPRCSVVMNFPDLAQVLRMESSQITSGMSPKHVTKSSTSAISHASNGSELGWSCVPEVLVSFSFHPVVPNLRYGEVLSPLLCAMARRVQSYRTGLVPSVGSWIRLSRGMVSTRHARHGAESAAFQALSLLPYGWQCLATGLPELDPNWHGLGPVPGSHMSQVYRSG